MNIVYKEFEQILNCLSDPIIFNYVSVKESVPDEYFEHIISTECLTQQKDLTSFEKEIVKQLEDIKAQKCDADKAVNELFIFVDKKLHDESFTQCHY